MLICFRAKERLNGTSASVRRHRIFVAAVFAHGTKSANDLCVGQGVENEPKTS